VRRSAAALATLAFVGVATAHAEPTPTAAITARRALERWHLTEAEGLVAKLKGPERLLLQARLDLMRSRFGEVDKRLAGKEEALGFEARVLRGQALEALGRRDEAFRVLDAMADAYNDDKVTTADDLAWLGVGLALTDYPKNALKVFKDALKLDPKHLEAQLAWGELYFTKYNYQDADPRFSAVLKADPGHVRAAVGKARVAIESDRAFGEATALLDPIVANHPECVPCHNVLALVDLHNERPAAAAGRLESLALKIAPADPEALALLGAAYYLMDDAKRFAAIEAKALALNPRHGGFYVTVAEHAEREHRYVEAIDLLERALALDPDDANALSMLGTGYSRTGDDARARDHLQRAFEADAYNVRTFNLLTHFYDKLDKRFDWVEAPPMQLRVDRVERPILAEVVPPLITEGYASLTKKWGFAPALPLHIELFADPKTFAVRSTGLPGLAAHGICFGHVITARSPSAGNFNWAEVLWHELAHVYHLQLSKGRVPRWFTEGLAVFESTEGRPSWRREQDRELLDALRAKKLRGINDFNLAFTQAKSLRDIVLAYYHAYFVTRFIHEAWGFGKARDMVKLWGEKRATPDVFKSALGVSLEAFDLRFERWLSETLAYLDKAYPFPVAALVARGDEVMQHASEASAERKAEAAVVAYGRRDRKGALSLAEDALALGDSPLARFVRAMILVEDDARSDEARRDLEALHLAGLAGADGLDALARLAMKHKAADDAATYWREAVTLDPQREDLREGLIAALDQANQPLEAFQARVALMQVDQMNAPLAIATLERAGLAKASPETVRNLAEQAEHIAPFSLEVHLAAARALRTAGDLGRARRHATLALTLDPTHAEAKAFLESR
jgi:tetratricopeptide (TPR) repeat protein